MKKTEQKYQTYVQILKEELIPAMGCTEPISLAYGASLARRVLNHLPTKIVVEASGSIIKNVKSVIVPHTHHLKGIKAAVCAGIIGGNDDQYLEVLSQIDEKTKKEIDQYIEKVDFEEHFLDSSKVFDYIITVWNKKEYVKVRISDSHMHVVCIEKNGKILQKEKSIIKKEKADRSLLDIKDIYDFITTVDLIDIQEILERHEKNKPQEIKKPDEKAENVQYQEKLTKINKEIAELNQKIEQNRDELIKINDAIAETEQMIAKLRVLRSEFGDIKEELNTYFEKYQLEIKKEDFCLKDPLEIVEQYKNKLIADKAIKQLILNGSPMEKGLLNELKTTQEKKNELIATSDVEEKKYQKYLISIVRH